MFRIRLSESAMPTGSKDPDVLLAWLLDSMGLVRRKSEGMSVDDEQGALHRLMRETLLSEPLRDGTRSPWEMPADSLRPVCTIN